MLPYITLPNTFFEVHTATQLALLAFLITLLYFIRRFHKEIPLYKILVLVVGASWVAHYGARFFYLFFEAGQESVGVAELTRFDGMTFYGSLAAGALFVLFFNKFFIKDSSVRLAIWDSSALALSYSYGLMRIGCFANGCCWGKISGLPWAVRYFDPRSVMPALGIPVHPVQLYDSFLGFLLFFILLMLRKKLAGQLIFIWGLLYPVGRFITEFYRGDTFRGEDIFMSMSTSQLISLGIFLFSAGALGRSYIKKNVKGVLALFSLLLLVGCLPSPPDYRYVSKFKILSEEGIFLYDMNNKLIVDEGELVDTNPNRNLIFVAIDDSVAPQFQPQINKLYKKNGQEAGPRAEDIAWWQLSKKIKTVYDKVIYITFDNFNRDSLKEAIVQAERLGKPYDLYLLTHGIPNHIKASAGEEFISYKDIAKLSGVATQLRFVYMQGCFSESLAGDWHKLGAQDVLAYEGWNRNFFYLDFFITQYRMAGNHNVGLAYKKTEELIFEKMKNSALYSMIFKMMGIGIDDYFAMSAPPIYTSIGRK
ncbi:MAG: hypothetical protein A2504_12550 [Bdellovibrionales bacterium RIFOXYD12_FULL_39_22]|nr:MAG: hypothetical protein A2385_00110 [Bdellovibrionales bacterium RIFOXYB1_FULL_39_21]OFZ44059.1 MAG: hypothetical protein A2485_03775 [Bdellovibrionales bacterium RIFOXYC12_FULL_39_17]OFZ48539.1 MAG: hypothetical protein A2404_07295 [Bdellovibrionales bacterium RIFOXYC1_FULL_39_130]OFZ76727.1 MAG: hypothetical protein A2560_11670 [Bdellovibrionales bacterium RIFOXYD1_FULL_39_84]OFZ95005.1 MAG: hypothetical protein A2504_12550 [Bdellovibrionales bacterium RIFOXYD12_FULL_39_22]HLE11186.1 pr